MTTRSWRYRFGSALPLGVLACLCSLAATGASAATWSLTQVDNSADVGKFASAAVDSNNKLHVSYVDAAGKLKYATNKSGSWSTPATIVSSGVVSAGTALAIDSSTDRPQINYYYYASTSNRGARNVLFNGTGWNPASNLNGSYTPLPNNSIAIFNKDRTSHVLFVKNAGGSQVTLNYTKNGTAGNYAGWDTPSSVDSTNYAGTNNAIVVDTAGTVHVVGYNSSLNRLIYYNNTTTNWPETTLSSSGGQYCSLAIDSRNNLHLTYLEGGRIKYRFKSPNDPWQAPVEVDDAAGSFSGYPSIAVDGSGNPHISYYYSNASGTGKLRYANNISGSWVSEDVDTSVANVGQYSSITVDSANTVNIAYYDVTNSALKVASAISSTPTVSFATTDRGFTSAPVTITVTNQESSAVTFGGLSKIGLNADEFLIESDGCSNLQLAPQVSCDIVARFAPPAAAPRSTARNATLSIPRSAPYSALAYALTGSTSANFLVTASASNGGSISPTKIAVAPNANQSFSVTTAPGFSVASVVADGTTQLTAPYALSNVTADHTVLASFASPIRVLESSIFYGSLQAALGVVNPGWTIQAQTVIPAGDLLVDRDVAVTLSGGYDSAFASQTGLTSLPGNIVVSNGTLAVENIVIQ